MSITAEDMAKINTHLAIESIDDYEAMMDAFIQTYKFAIEKVRDLRKYKVYCYDKYKSADKLGDTAGKEDMAKQAATCDYEIKIWEKMKQMMDKMAHDTLHLE